ncbi:DUF1836 domain-containing protein [uncultured Pseudoflavonifractor sp.]|uniref:DUF1836 domain-containing protein n=1 Tax=uncultured Pseudoflavonifractor sp. TaxID=1221379 RepID=UPI0025E93D53|nr:DUF1836 domain-containing protein [uncultured Pseudoflavonifractor sp.]
MEEIEELKRRLAEERPQAWDAFPDIGLYMDQIISYMPRQLIHFSDEDSLTSAMVNNYIKDGMLPRAEGKRYNRTHLAYLTAICALKQVLSVRDASRLIGAGVDFPEKDTRGLYEYFRRELDRALTETAESLDENLTEDRLPALALGLALRSYADKLACQRVLDIIQMKHPQAEREVKSKEKSKK